MYCKYITLENQIIFIIYIYKDKNVLGCYLLQMELQSLIYCNSNI